MSPAPAPASSVAAAPSDDDAPSLAEATTVLAGVESVDLSYLVDGHLDYRAKLESVIEFLAFEE